MAICRIVETGATPEQYDQVRDRVGVGDSTPPGGIFHLAAVGADGKVRVVEAWESREQADQFGERVRTAREELGHGDRQPEITYYDVHNLVRA
ncbi:MAG: hypothetical protein V7644_2759 [Actinomycetota bacterium]|jgi:hypothetical protein